MKTYGGMKTMAWLRRTNPISRQYYSIFRGFVPTPMLSLRSRHASTRSTKDTLIRLQNQWQRMATADGHVNLWGDHKATNHLNNNSSDTETPSPISLEQPPVAPKRAAVLVLLLLLDHANHSPQRPSYSVLLTRRSAHLSKHAAEISFPGGQVDPNDATLVETAIREAVEELYGTDSDGTSNEAAYERNRQHFVANLSILGAATTTPVPSIHNVHVTPVVALYTNTSPMVLVPPEWTGNPSEVDQVCAVSLDELLAVETTHELPPSSRHRTSVRRRGPLFPTHMGDIWGLTAFILRPILHQLWKPVLF